MPSTMNQAMYSDDEASLIIYEKKENDDQADIRINFIHKYLHS